MEKKMLIYPMIKDYVSQFLNGEHNNGWGVWHIYAWQKWAYNHVNNINKRN